MLWMLSLYLHVNQKSDDGDDDDILVILFLIFSIKQCSLIRLLLSVCTVCKCHFVLQTGLQNFRTIGAVKGSEYSPAIALSEEKDKKCA